MSTAPSRSSGAGMVHLRAVDTIIMAMSTTDMSIASIGIAIAGITSTGITAMAPDANRQLLFLLQLTTTSFPTGAFNHSYGFETWIDAGEINSAPELEVACQDWLQYSAAHGDAAIAACAHRAAAAGDFAALINLDQICSAIKLSREAREASDKTGRALLRALRDIFSWAEAADYLRAIGAGDCEGHYPVVFGAAAASFGIAERPAILAYLFSAFSNLIGVAARLIPLGQTESQRLIYKAWPALQSAADSAIATPIAMIGTAMVGLDVASMRHERIHTRLCMS
jgi:urease accessory protein